MKFILCTLAVFTLVITALHAQSAPASPVPEIITEILPKIAPDPVVQQAVTDLLPPQYAAYGAAIIVVLTLILSIRRGLKNGLSFGGAVKATLESANVPSKLPLLIACLCMLGLSNCETMKKLERALSTPQAQKVELALVDLGLHVAVGDGYLSPGDMVTIGNGVAVVTSGASTISKVSQLADLGLNRAVAKGIVKPGDAILIKDTTAIVTQAITPVAALSPPAVVVGP